MLFIMTILAVYKKLTDFSLKTAASFFLFNFSSLK
jgi:hypothetical protein